MINKKGKDEIKKLAIDILEELKRDKLKIEQWYEKSTTVAAVFNFVSNTLYDKLPYPTYENDDIDLKANMVFSHLKSQYFGGGRSVYGQY